MTQRHFVRWLLRQGLTGVQVKMAAILYAVNGYESVAEFVAKMQQLEETKGISQ